MKKITLSLLSILCITAAHALNPDILRKLVLHSDVIFAGQTTLRTLPCNDHTEQVFFTVDRIERMLHNKAGLERSDTVKIPQQFRDFPYFRSDDHVHIHSLKLEEEPEKSYTNICFVRRESGLSNFVSVGGLVSVEWGEFLSDYLPAIGQMLEIAEITDLAERYSRTIDWYIRWNGYPERDFLDYYRSRGVIGDTVLLTPPQQQMALERFRAGSEKLLPFVRDLYPDQVRSYYLEVMKSISEKRDPKYEDKSRFRRAVEDALLPDYSSVENYLKWQLVSPHIDSYDLRRIMRYFIDMLEQSNKESGGK